MESQEGPSSAVSTSEVGQWMEEGQAAYDAAEASENPEEKEEFYKKAFALYQKAAEQGIPEVQHNLGFMYLSGLGVRQSYEKAFEWFQKAAEQGDPEAQSNLGFMYRDGYGVAQDDKKAFEWLEKAAEQGLAPVQFKLGVMYDKGQGVEQSHEKAFEWFEKAAKQGFAAAQNNLGAICLRGLGVVQDDKKAFEWFQKAAEQGFPQGQSSLGFMYQEGRAVVKDDQKAFEWYEKAAVQGGLAHIQFHLACMYDKGQGVEQSDEKAFEWYKKAAMQGFAKAQSNLGLMYQKGWGVAQDDKKAFEWFQKAAVQGLAQVQFNLSLMYQKGRGVAQDNKKALKCLQQAAEQGLADAQNALGAMYREGRGTDQSYEKAFEWFEKAAKQGLADAQNALGAMYGEGRGTDQSYEKAFEWFQKAAEQGLAEAQCNLGVMYQEGRGVAQDDHKAAEWFEKAAKQGFAAAQNNLGGLYREARGVEQSDQEAAELFKKGAAQGLADAQNNLGNIYFQGKGVAQSYAEAAKWYKKAAEQGFVVAQNNLGFMCLGGYGAAQPAQEAVEWFQNAAAQGHIRAQDNLSVSYFLGQGTLKAPEKAFRDATPGLCENFSLPSPENICSAVTLIKNKLPFEQTTFDHLLVTLPYLENNHRELAGIGNAQSQFHLGLLHHFGIGVRQDLVQAFEWYEEAAQGGHQDAKKLLKELLSSFLPPIIEKNFPLFLVKKSSVTTDEKVFELWKKAADAGDHKALYRLGRCYLYGWGTPQNTDLALDCFKKSAQEEWYSPAQKAFAKIVESTSSVEAIRWYRRAAKRGDVGGTAAIKEMADDYVTEAMYALGQAYEEGWAIAKDGEEALVLYDRAASEKKYPKAQYKKALQKIDAPDALELLSQASGAEERKNYLKAIGKKFNPKEIQALEKKGYYRAQQALADLYQKGRIIPFKNFQNVLKAYEHAVALHKKASGKHVLQEAILQAQAKYEQLKKSQEEGKVNFDETWEEVLKKFPILDENRDAYEPDFLYQVVYLCQKVQDAESENKVHEMLGLLAGVSEKKKQTKISQGLMGRLSRAVEAGGEEKLAELSTLFNCALKEKSWALIPPPEEETPQDIRVSIESLKDPRIEIFNACIQPPDQSVDQDVFNGSVNKILKIFENLEERKSITRDGLFDPEGVGTRKTLEDFLRGNQSNSRFAYRIVRLSDLLDGKMKRDPEHVAVILMSWAKAGNFCRLRSEEETYTYYITQLTDPAQDLNDLGKDYWTLEVYVARSLAQLRERLVDQQVPDQSERVHQVAHLKRKVRKDLSLLGDAEFSQDMLEQTSVLPEYQSMSSDDMVQEVLKQYTPDYMATYIATEIDKAAIPYEKLVRRLRVQFLREEFAKALKKSPDSLDKSLFKDEDFVLSDACDQHYITSAHGSGITFDWQALKGKSYAVAQERLVGFYEDEMMEKFSQRGARAILKGMGYLQWDEKIGVK